LIPEKKICGWCNIKKEASCFALRKKNGKTTLRLECKECNNKKRMKAYYEHLKPKVIARNKIYYEQNKDKINTYKKQWDADNFVDRQIKRKQSYLENSKEVRAERKKYYYKNREQIIEANVIYIKKNLSRVRENQRKRHEKRKTIDVHYKLLKTLRGRVTMAIKRENGKCAATMNLVGCSIQYLRQHLENKFLPGMGWHNHNFRGWHIDHIKPIASFDLKDPEQQKICFHYTNLQPLWGVDNMKKGAKVA
jgi:hypothetical protein